MQMPSFGLLTATAFLLSLTSALQCLRAQEPDGNLPGGVPGPPPILQAAERGDWETVDKFLTSGVDPNTVDASGKAALWHACDRTSMEGVELLLKHSALVDTATLVRPTRDTLPALPALGPLCTFHQPGIAESHMEFWGGLLLPLLSDFKADQFPALIRNALPSMDEKAAKRQLPLLTRLLEAGADPNFLHHGFSPLSCAAGLPTSEVLVLLLKHKAKVEGVPGQILSPLAMAVLLERGPHVRLLLNSGADPELPVAEGFGPDVSPFFLGALGRDAGIFDLLIAPALRSKDPSSLARVLSGAAAAGKLDAVRSLLAAGANPDFVLGSGSTPLHVAASSPNAEVLSALLAASKEIDLRDRSGFTPLQNACERLGTAANVELLLQRGADVESRTNEQYPPLLTAAEHSDTEVVQCLLDAGADPLVRSGDGLNALYCAANNRTLDPRTFRLLLKAGAEVDGKTTSGSTPLHVLSGGPAGRLLAAKLREPSLSKIEILLDRQRPLPAENDYVACLKVLLKHGANPNIPELAPVGPLNVAVMAAAPLILETLIEGGAGLDTPPGECAPLHLAALAGEVRCARILLKAGASPDRPVYNGMTPRETTSQAKANRKEIIQLFSEFP